MTTFGKLRDYVMEHECASPSIFGKLRYYVMELECASPSISVKGTVSNIVQELKKLEKEQLNREKELHRVQATEKAEELEKTLLHVEDVDRVALEKEPCASLLRSLKQELGILVA